MNIEDMLNNFTNREDLVSFIRDLPDGSTGIMCFCTPSDRVDEDGDKLELLKYKTYGSMSKGDAFLMCHEAADMVRGL